MKTIIFSIIWLLHLTCQIKSKLRKIVHIFITRKKLQKTYQHLFIKRKHTSYQQSIDNKSFYQVQKRTVPYACPQYKHDKCLVLPALLAFPIFQTHTMLSNNNRFLQLVPCILPQFSDSISKLTEKELI